jgi:3-oxoacyl-[acyl-carrier-protein] synthase III
LEEPLSGAFIGPQAGFDRLFSGIGPCGSPEHEVSEATTLGTGLTVPYAQLGPIAIHLPERVETNDMLQEQFPRWDLALIEEKTGIRQRHIAGTAETASDLAVKAAQKLFETESIQTESIDFLLLCTQTPDYPLPTTACLIQDRLGLKTSCGAMDFNLGCSGYVYGLALADGLIQSGVAKNILLLTAETYSKYIDEDDRSLRTIFGDGATATLINAGKNQTLRGFQFGSDGSGGDMLLVADGGQRSAKDAIKPRHRKRWKSRLYMDGPSLINFTVDAIPRLVNEILAANQMTDIEIGKYLMHQATWKMLDQLRTRMDVSPERLPIDLADIGNTVSCTLPILIDRLRKRGEIDAESVNMLVGFGVGLSWAGCLWQDQHPQ